MPVGASYQEYRAREVERDPTLAEDARDASVELGLGIALDHLRRQRGVTQRQLAEVSGIKQPMVARIERGSQSPGVAVLTRILSALNGFLTIGPDGRITAHAADLDRGSRARVGHAERRGDFRWGREPEPWARDDVLAPSTFEPVLNGQQSGESAFSGDADSGVPSSITPETYERCD